jgi:general secretion pathway protein D
VQEWLDTLDSVSDYEAQHVYIYHVQNGKAEELVNILEKIYGTGTDAGKKTKKAGRPETMVRGPITFIENQATNSIVIKAIPYDYQIIKHTIQQLDIFTQQVLIEVFIGEVTLSGDTEYGVEWALLGDRASIGGYKGTDKAEMDFGTGGLGTDLENNLGRGFTYRFDSDRLQAFIMAQASKNKLKVLSRPQIMVEDNQKAHIEVGQEVPIITSEYVPMEQEETTSTSRSIEYRSTGVILDVTPRINENGLVTIEINQEISEAQGVVSSGIQSPVITNRKAETSVAVSDGQTIIIGGIIKDQSSESVSGVPLLSDIPLIGYMFSDTKQKHEKTELIITITPHVVASAEDIEKANTLLQDTAAKIKDDVSGNTGF